MALMQVKPICISSDFRISIWHDLATDFCARTRKSEWAASSHFSSHLSFFFTFCSHSFPPRRLLFLLFPNALRLTKPVLITIQTSRHRILQDSKPPSLEVPRRDARSVNNFLNEHCRLKTRKVTPWTEIWRHASQAHTS